MNKKTQQNISIKKGNDQNASSDKAKTLDGWQAVTLRPDRRNGNREHHLKELIRRHTLSGFHMKDIQNKLDNYRNLLEKVRNWFSSFYSLYSIWVTSPTSSKVKLNVQLLYSEKLTKVVTNSAN